MRYIGICRTLLFFPASRTAPPLAATLNGAYTAQTIFPICKNSASLYFPHMRYIMLKAFICLVTALSVSPARAALPTPDEQRLPPLEVMVGQMIMTGFRGTGQAPKSPEFSLFLEDVRSGKIGGVILFDRDWTTQKNGRNIVSREQVRALTKLLQQNAPTPLFIAVDQEGGKVRRLKPEHGFPEMPSARRMGTLSPENTYHEALRIGQALHDVGINLNFAPVADTATADSPAIARLDRAFSTVPSEVAAHAAAFARGLGKAGVVAAYKHFPGHGSAAADSHHGFTDISTSWSIDELLPYTTDRLPRDSLLMVMTGHLFLRQRDEALPASLSPSITTELLRQELGWNGVVITDDLQMEAIARSYSQEESLRLALHAGADILLLGNNLYYDPQIGRKMHETIMRLVENGEISKERIITSWKRIINLNTAISPPRALQAAESSEQ